MKELNALLGVATDIAERASKIAMGYFRQTILIEMKENGTPVTLADKKTEEFIRKELQISFPSFGILGEEFGQEGRDREYVWTVDPIDGTRSFIRGIPLFGTLLGLLENNEPIAGIMVLPCLNETYTAARGMGTYCNGHQLHVSQTASLEAANISCGDTYCFEDAGQTQFLKSLIDRAEAVRGYTDCFGHSLVLRGGLDAMIDPVVSLWDVAPLACLIREAGGDYYDFSGERTIQGTSFVASNGKLRPEILKALSDSK
jgi:histidinol-phosphatase